MGTGDINEDMLLLEQFNVFTQYYAAAEEGSEHCQ